MDVIWVFVSSQDWEEASCSDIMFIVTSILDDTHFIQFQFSSEKA